MGRQYRRLADVDARVVIVRLREHHEWRWPDIARLLGVSQRHAERVYAAAKKPPEQVPGQMSLEDVVAHPESDHGEEGNPR